MGEFARQRQKRWDHGDAGKEDVGFVRQSRPLLARARPHRAFRCSLALLAALLAASACDNSSEPDLVPAPDLRSCADYQDYLHIEGSVSLDYHGTDVLVAADRAYVASQWKIIVFDLTGSDLPTKVFEIAADASHLAMAGDDLFAVAGHRFSIIDLHNPDSPMILSKLSLPFNATNIATDGSYVYITAGERGLWIVDCSQRTTPHIVGSIDTPDDAMSVAVKDGIACVAEGLSLITIDVSNPASPRRLGSIEDLGVFAVQFTETYVFAAGVEFYVIDMSDPAFPTIVSSHYTGTGCRDLVVDGTRVYAAGNGFAALSVANSAHPTTIGRIDGQQAHALAHHGDRLLLSWDDLCVIDAENAQPPRPLARIQLSRSSYLGSIAVDGPTACIASSDGLIVADIDRIAPAVIGRVFFYYDRIQAIVVNNGHAFTACDVGGLRIFNVEDSPPRMVGQLDLPGTARGICTDAGLAYLALESFGLWIADVSDPVNPKLLGSVDTPRYATDVAVMGARAYVTDGELFVVDVSNPSVPTVKGSVQFGGAVAIDLAEEKAFVASDHFKLGIFDLANPDEPLLIGELSVPDQLRDIDVSNDCAYVSSRSGSHVIDISNPTSPVLLGFIESIYTPGLVVNDKQLYLTNDTYLDVMPLQCELSAGF